MNGCNVLSCKLHLVFVAVALLSGFANVYNSCEAQVSYPFDIAAVIGALQSNNFDVDVGVWSVFNVSSCYTQPSCFGNNPTSPYVSFQFPNNPNWQLSSTGTSSGFILPNQAVIFVGVLPTIPTRYYGFTPYLITRYRQALRFRSIMFDSVSDTLNKFEIKNSSGIVTVYSAANVAISSTLSSVLQTVLPASSLNALPLPGQLLNLGNSSTSDTFGYLARFVFENSTAGLAYLNSPPGYVLMVTAKYTPPPALFGYPQFRQFSYALNETYLNSSLTNLVNSVIASHPSLSYKLVSVSDKLAQINYQNGFSCINLTLNCNGDNRDARYLGASDIYLPDNAFNFLYVVGVVHKLVGKATYSNVVVSNQNQSLGVVGIIDSDYTGSAYQFIPTDPNESVLYALKVARNCGAASFCVTVTTDYPTGIPVGTPMSIVERVYVDPASLIQPAQGTVLLPYVIQFSP